MHISSLYIYIDLYPAQLGASAGYCGISLNIAFLLFSFGKSTYLGAWVGVYGVTKWLRGWAEGIIVVFVYSACTREMRRALLAYDV